MKSSNKRETDKGEWGDTHLCAEDNDLKKILANVRWNRSTKYTCVYICWEAGWDLHRPHIKGTKLFVVIQAIIIVLRHIWSLRGCLQMSHPDYANHCNQSCAQETARIHASPWRSRSCVATQASSDRPPWCRPHPVCLWFALKRQKERKKDTRSFAAWYIDTGRNRYERGHTKQR